MKPVFLRAALPLAALLLAGAGCQAPSSALSAKPVPRCQTQADSRKQQDMAADPGIQAYDENNYYNASLRACVFTVEYAGKMKRFPGAKWVVDLLVINTDDGQVLAEYLTVDGVQNGVMNLTGFEDAKSKLFSQ